MITAQHAKDSNFPKVHQIDTNFQTVYVANLRIDQSVTYKDFSKGGKEAPDL